MLHLTAHLSCRRFGDLKATASPVRLAVACGLLALLFGPATSLPAHAAVFTVNSAGDQADTLPGDSVCFTRAGTCTLRAAIQEANALVGRDSVVFNIPGVVPITLQPASPLPGIVRRMTVDATTQPGFAGRPVVHLEGTSAGAGANGLRLTGPGNLVRGFVISRFSGHGILVSGSDNTIQGNFIGTNLRGMGALGNTRTGVQILGASNNVIGGATPGDGNVISGNGLAGVDIVGGEGNRVQGNHIGTNARGTAALGNGRSGVVIEAAGGSFTGPGASFNVIGGLDRRARNLISGNGTWGIEILGAKSTGNVVLRNFIGTDVNGTGPLGNRGGVLVRSGTNNHVGGQIIAFNTEFGVVVHLSGAAGNRITENGIFSNGTTVPGLGIDLAFSDDSGVTPNDLRDADVGPNLRQNFPLLTSARSAAGAISIQGTLHSTPAGVFTVEFFASAVCDPSGHGEGERFLGATQVTTDAIGNGRFSQSLPVGVPVGQVVTATATDATGNTSEFSPCHRVVAGP